MDMDGEEGRPRREGIIKMSARVRGTEKIGIGVTV